MLTCELRHIDHGDEVPVLSRRRAFRKILGRVAALSVVVATSGCGTILHPERRGQPAGRIDWKIAGLNGLGLILFFIPGVIAFAVDFNNGTIYLPPGDSASAAPPETLSHGLRVVSCGTRHPEFADIERVLRERVEVNVDLRHDDVHVSPLASIREFWTTKMRLSR